jgi:hypothetical protein
MYMEVETESEAEIEKLPPEERHAGHWKLSGPIIEHDAKAFHKLMTETHVAFSVARYNEYKRRNRKYRVGRWFCWLATRKLTTRDLS